MSVFPTIQVLFPLISDSPYIMDLGSTNGTFLNGTKVDPNRYVELMEKDVLKFGSSTRDYVVMNERTQM